MSFVFPSLDPTGSNVFLCPCCPRCDSNLSLHQPDEDLPDRLLATCDFCKAWYWTDDGGLKLRRIDAESDKLL